MNKHVLCLPLAKKLLAFSLAILASMAITSVSNADVIAIDFGATAPGTPFYNQSFFTSAAVNTTDIADLVRLADGTNTGISLTVGGNPTGTNGSGVGGNGGNATDASIFADGISSVGGVPNAGQPGNNILTFTFAGLDDTLTYDLVGGTSRAPAANLGNFLTDWTTSSLGGNGGSTLSSDASIAAGYVNFTDLTSTGGSLTITVTDAAALSAVSQIALTVNPAVVPEPSSMLACVFGMGLTVLRRRRR